MRNEDHPLIDCPHRGCARGRQDYEQRLQEQRSHVVRSDVHRTAPHNGTTYKLGRSDISSLPAALVERDAEEDLGRCLWLPAVCEMPAGRR